MVRRAYRRLIVLSLMSFLISLPICARADNVGNFSRVQNRVDYRKGGTGSAIPARMQDPVWVKDLILTYDLSRAQVRFRDNSIITVSPDSKVTIENYLFDRSKFERNAKLKLIRGVMNVVVSVLRKERRPNFIIKTSTAVIGVRGTEFIVISGTNFSVVYDIKGRVCIESNVKQPGKYRVHGVAPGVPPGLREVCLDPGTMSVILKNQPPSTPQPVTPEVMSQAEGLVFTGIPEIPESCTICGLPGVNLEYVANDLMSRGADLNSVKSSLAAVFYSGARTYSYSPPGPPSLSVGVWPTFPGYGRVEVASPSQ
jgi:hypothetical protein